MSAPGPPGRPTFADSEPTTLTVNWGGADWGGNKLLFYIINQYKTSDTSGIPDRQWKADNSSGNTRNLTGLLPGQHYWFIVRAVSDATQNGGYGAWSPPGDITLPTGLKIRKSNSLFLIPDPWYPAIPYVRDGGVWKPVYAYIRKNGKWQPTD